MVLGGVTGHLLPEVATALSDVRTTTQHRVAALALGLVIVGCVAQVILNLAGGGMLAIIAKMTASSGFVLLALDVGATGTRFGQAILTGLGFSWLGDLFLAGGTEMLFLAGLVAFLLGHVAYVVAFSIHGVARSTVLVSLAGTALVSGLVANWLLGYVPGPMAVPVLAYMMVISTMVAMAFGTRAAGGSLLLPVGAVMFYLSDLSVAAGQFVKPDFPNYVWGLPLYFGGQALLALAATGKSPETVP